MGEVINLLEYKEEKMAQELKVIEDLRQELREVIADLGGIYTVPTFFLANSQEELSPIDLHSLPHTLDGYDTYTVTDERTKD